MDLEPVMLLVQRRYGHLREISRLTVELKDFLDRKDQVSVLLLLKMRAEEMAKIDECQERLYQTAAQAGENASYLKKLISCPPWEPGPDSSFEERKILEIRQKSETILREIRQLDERLNLGVGGEKSFYKEKSNK